MPGSVRDDIERVRRLIAQQERTVRDAFEAYIRETVELDDLLALLTAGNIEAALELVDARVLRLSTVIPQIYATAGTASAAHIADQLGVISIGFDPTDETAARHARENKLQFVRELTESQRESTRQALTRAFQDGAGPRQTATAFRDSIGLTVRQEQAVRNYRSLLERGSKEALNRDLRDRRFDRTVARADEKPLTTQQIDRMVERYRERYRQYRAEVIARTEGVRATSMAQQDALDQVVEQTGAQVERTWHRTADARTRDAHDVMEGQKVGKDEPFIDGDGNQLMFPGDPDAPIETTAQCRCVITTRLL